jgi:hypothetical protein
MKSRIRGLLILSGLLCLIGSATAIAQQFSDKVAFATTFPFSVGNTTLPAGKYVVRPLEDDKSVLEVSGVNTTTTVMFDVEPTSSEQPHNKGEVVFKKYGDKYVLSEVWQEGSTAGALAVKSRLEQMHEKKAGAAPTKQSVATSKQ